MLPKLGGITCELFYSNSNRFTCLFLKVATKDEKMLRLIDRMNPILHFWRDINNVKSFVSQVYYVKFSKRFSGILTGHQTSECVNIASPKAVRWEDGTNWSFKIKVMLMLNVGENPPHQMRGTEHIPVSKQNHSRKQHWLSDKWYCKLPSRFGQRFPKRKHLEACKRRRARIVGGNEFLTEDRYNF